MIKELKNDIEELKNKKSWIRKGFKELMDDINSELNFDGELNIDYILDGLTKIKQDEYHYEYDFSLSIREGELFIGLIDYNPIKQVNKYNKSDLTVNDIRLILNEFKDFLDYLKLNLQGENHNSDLVIEKIKKINNSLG